MLNRCISFFSSFIICFILVFLANHTLLDAAENDDVSQPETDAWQILFGRKMKVIPIWNSLSLLVPAEKTDSAADRTFMLMDGNHNIYSQISRNNTEEITHFENGLGVLETVRDESGKILRRYYYPRRTPDDFSGYVDKDGDGLFDIFVDHKSRQVKQVILQDPEPANAEK